MITRDSKSYPYLAIAQHYNVPYGEVLSFVEALENNFPMPAISLRWEVEACRAFIDECNRRIVQCNIK